MNNHFAELIRASENTAPIYNPGPYWKHYQQKIHDTVSGADMNELRSGKYKVFNHFGFSEYAYREIKSTKQKLRILGSVFRNLFLRSRAIIPYDLDIRDVQLMAYHHGELYAKLTQTPGPENYSISTFGNPTDQFKIGKNTYNILSLSYFLRMCFVNKNMRFRGDEIIVELGSGSCHQIEVLKKIYPDLTVLCFDLPGPLFLGEKFMEGVFGKEKIVSSQKCMHWENLDKLEKGKIHFFGNWQCEMIRNFGYDLFWNAASFGEMEPSIVKHYIQVFTPSAKNVYLLQATKGKEKHRVNDPISFSDYSTWLEGFEQTDAETAYKAHKPLSASGGYTQAFWRKPIP